jgi:hypothetical protein
LHGQYAKSGKPIFETVVFSQHPQLKSIKGKLLKLGARTARDQAAWRLRQKFGNEKVHPVSLISRSRYRSMWWRQLQNHMEGKTWPPLSRFAQ